jgi:hypothetical protein
LIIKLRLMNSKEVDVTPEEMQEFITEILLQNPDWRHSGLLTPMEWTRYLQGRSTPDELLKVARYLLIYTENLSFTAYLFDKSEGHPESGKEFNMPVVKKLRELYRVTKDMVTTQKGRANNVHEMERLCLSIGTDPL